MRGSAGFWALKAFTLPRLAPSPTLIQTLSSRGSVRTVLMSWGPAAVMQSTVFEGAGHGCVVTLPTSTTSEPDTIVFWGVTVTRTARRDELPPWLRTA